MTITRRVAVLGASAEGGADFNFFSVTLRQEQYDNGDHYEAVEAEAELDGQLIAFDENDPGWRALNKRMAAGEFRALDISKEKLLS